MNCQSEEHPQPNQEPTAVASQAMDIVNTLGLHARAAGKFSALAAEFPCQIRVTRGQRTVDGKSIMGLMMLAAGCGSQILVEAEGDQAEEALAALSRLVANGFDEGPGAPSPHPSDKCDD